MATAITTAFPIVATLADCTDFSKTVSPYLHQFSLSHVLPLLRGEVAPMEWYLGTNPVVTALLFALATAVVCFVSSEINRNLSQVDRLWSILPSVYTAHFVAWSHMNGIGAERVDTLATFVALWSVRLTFNYWRKGGYQIGSEDYRWPVLRSKLPAPALLLLNIVFTALFQNLSLVSITMPTYILLLFSQLPDASASDFMDMVFSRGLIVVLAIEALADQQQWSFQQAKQSFKATGEVPEGFTREDLERGFVVSGLWSFSRHPNFACEQAIWLGVYQWSCYRTDTLFNWTAIGVATYCAIFVGSTIFTEKLSAEKYPEYKEYQMLVNKLIPSFSAFMGGGIEDMKKVEKKE